jgi:hypothetical protein
MDKFSLRIQLETRTRRISERNFSLVVVQVASCWYRMERQRELNKNQEFEGEIEFQRVRCAILSAILRRRVLAGYVQQDSRAEVIHEKASTNSLRKAQQAQQRRGWPEVPLLVRAIDLVFECDPSGEPASKDDFSLRIQPES